MSAVVRKGFPLGLVYGLKHGAIIFKMIILLGNMSKLFLTLLILKVSIILMLVLFILGVTCVLKKSLES